MNDAIDNDSADMTKVMASFRIIGDDFDLDEVTRLLDITPTLTRTKGIVSEGRNRVAAATFWSVSTPAECVLDVNIPLNKIILQLASKAEALLQIKQRYQEEVIFRFELTIYIEQQQSPAIYFSTATLAFIHQIGAEIDIDQYIYS